MRVAENLMPCCDFAPTVNVRSVGAFGSDSSRVTSLNLRGRRTEKPPSVDAAVSQPDASGSPAWRRCIVIPGGKFWPKAGTINISDAAEARKRHERISDDSAVVARHARTDVR